MLTSVEMCAGAGGQALGLEQAGFEHRALIEIEPHFAATLRLNRPQWHVYNSDLRVWAREQAHKYAGIDLLAGGLPCPPFSVAGKQLGAQDERNLFPAALEIIEKTRPKAVLIENVRGFLSAVFEDYRKELRGQLGDLGYVADWRLLNACDFGVPQLRPRVAIVAYRRDISDRVEWPVWDLASAPTVGQTLVDLMAARGWRGAGTWASRANEVAPTLVGGSMKHGGPDLGPTRAKRAWEALGVDGMGIADDAPPAGFVGRPRLTVRMAARLQGFADDWQFSGRKTMAYKQVGNAFPPPVARVLGLKIRGVLERASRRVERLTA